MKGEGDDLLTLQLAVVDVVEAVVVVVADASSWVNAVDVEVVEHTEILVVTLKRDTY